MRSQQTPNGASPKGLAGEPHRRYNPLIDEWVLVSAGRGSRPWLGAEEPEPNRAGLAFDPDCYLCPGNVRANGNVNPQYDETFVFTNDFSALRPDTSIATLHDGLLRAQGERGECRVVCFSPRPDLTLDFPLGVTLMQLCGHATHHRAQALNMVRHLGGPTREFDYLLIFDES